MVHGLQHDTHYETIALVRLIQPSPWARTMRGIGMEIRPQAAAIPKETDHLEQGKYGPVYPKTPACYGFTIIAKVKPGRADAIRNHGHTLAKAVEADPQFLAPLKLHYLRWVLFDDETRFLYQGLFDTDFDT